MNSLTVREKYFRYWPAIAIGSGVLAFVLFGAYMLSSDVLLEGYLRFGAFIFFALSLLSFFKWKHGQIKIDVTLGEDNSLKMNYFVRNKHVASEQFNLSEFEEFQMSDMPNKSLYNDLPTGDRCIRFRKKNDDGWMYLTEVHGRVIPLDKNNAERVIDFIRKHMN